DPGWRIVKGGEKGVRRADGTLNMEPDTSFGHPSAMLSSEIGFNFISTGFSTVKLRLFCAGTDPAGSTNVVILHMGERICSGLEGSDGQFDNQIQTKTSSSTVAVRLAIQDKQVELYLDDVMIQRFPIPPNKRSGA